MSIATVFLGLAALSVGAPSVDVRDQRPAAIQQDSWEGLRQKLGLAIDQERLEDALLYTKALLAHPDTARIPAAERRALVWLQALLNLQLDRPALALPLLVELTAAPEATQEQWNARLQAVLATDDMNAAAATLTEVITRFPSAASEYYDVFVIQTAMNPELQPDVAFRLREALLQSGWTHDSASWIWMKLLDDYQDRGRLDDARALVSRINSPGARLQLFSLRRYDEVRPADARLDLDSAWSAELMLARKKAEKPDASIEDRSGLASTLYDLGRLEEALAASEAVISAGPPADDDDAAEDYTWALNGQSRILLSLQRGDEAVTVQQSAAARTEYGTANVSQAINLGWTFLRLGRPADAVQALIPVKDDQLSGYGQMQARQVRACAARESGDLATAEPLEALVAEHWKDAPIAAYEVAACRGDEEAMARVLIDMLGDPETAPEGVGLMHDYLDTGWTEYDLRMNARHARVIARPEVVAARDAVGRAFVVPTVGPQF